MPFWVAFDFVKIVYTFWRLSACLCLEPWLNPSQKFVRWTCHHCSLQLHTCSRLSLKLLYLIYWLTSFWGCWWIDFPSEASKRLLFFLIFIIDSYEKCKSILKYYNDQCKAGRLSICSKNFIVAFLWDTMTVNMIKVKLCMVVLTHLALSIHITFSDLDYIWKSQPP